MYSQMAMLQLEKGDITNARRYYNLATDSRETLADSLAALSALSRIHEAEGDYKNAYKEAEIVYDNTYRLTDKIITHPYTALVNDYYRSEVDQKRQCFIGLNSV